MSVLSSIEDTIKEHFSSGPSAPTSVGLSVDVNTILEIVNAIISAAPAIEQGLVSATPFVEAIMALIANGGKPTDAQWADLKARLDANSGTLAAAEAEAQSEIDNASAGDTGATGPVSGDTGPSNGATGATGVGGEAGGLL